MYQTGNVLEVPITNTTDVSDLVDFFNKEKINKLEHPTIKLKPDDAALILVGILFLFSALLILEKQGKLKLLSKKKGKTLPTNIGKLGPEERIEKLIERNYNVDVVIESARGKKYYVQVKNTKPATSLRNKYKHLPIDWGKGKPSIDDFAGLWGGRNITLDQIRQGAWQRN